MSDGVEAIIADRQMEDAKCVWGEDFGEQGDECLPVCPAPLAPGLKLYACYGPMDGDGNPAKSVQIAGELEQSTAKALANGYSLSPPPGHEEAAEFRAYDGTGMLRIRRVSVTVA